MRPARIEPRPWRCHWSHVNGRSARGQQTRTLVWICEYPYRTMRATGPCSDCEGCPAWEARTALMRRDEAATDLVTTH